MDVKFWFLEDVINTLQAVSPALTLALKAGKLHGASI